MNRRHALRTLLGSSLVLPGILSDLLAAEAAPEDPLAPKPPHFPAKAKRVIFLHMSGGVSHVDSFDTSRASSPRIMSPYQVPKQMLNAFATENRSEVKFFKRPQWEYKQRGQSGLWISELFPKVAERADDLCLIRSMYTDNPDHAAATLGLHTGSISFARPSMGSWISYGLGSENANLPSFMVLAPALPYAGAEIWSNNFLPGCHAGTHVTPGPEPVPNIQRRLTDPELQKMELGLAGAFNRRHLSQREADPQLAARVRSFETAFGMQAAAPEAFDLTHEDDATHALYGLPRGSTKGFAWQCLVARRLAERGVRFLELIDTGAGGNWDSHGNMDDHVALARNVDQPIAALVTDLQQRGLLEDTLVVWATEFGRTPFNTAKDAKGREHHAQAFTCWMAGAGVRGGHSHGESDEYGNTILNDGVHVHDFHATILHLMGLDHTRLTYRHAGRDYRLTDVAGNVVQGVLA